MDVEIERIDISVIREERVQFSPISQRSSFYVQCYGNFVEQSCTVNQTRPVWFSIKTLLLQE
jgi:hypothetical protein